jgi:uncharacterized protein
VKTPPHPLRLNIGFLIGQPIGIVRDFNFEYPEIKIGDDLDFSDFRGKAVFNRTPQGLFLQADFQGSNQMECVRCLEVFDQKLIMTFSDLYAFDHRSISESGLLVPESGYIDLEPLLREYAILEIPISPICKVNCKGLCLECGQDLNKKDCGHHQAGSETPFSQIESSFKENSG